MRAPIHKRLDHYLFERVDGSSLSLLRILFGAFLCWSFTRLTPWVDLLFAAGGVRYSLILRSAPPLVYARLLWGLMLACALLFTLGVKSRWMARLLIVLFGYHYLLALAATSAVVDRLTLIFLTIAAFSELDSHFALVPERARSPVASWPHRMFSLQLFFLYTGAALWKLTYVDWLSGEMLREALSGGPATPLAFALARLPLPDGVWHALTWTVMAAESAMGLLYLSRRSAAWAFALATGFHLTIALLLAIDEFVVCLSVAPAALEPARVAGFVSSTRRRCRALLGRTP
jgi:hypothetical protein